MVVVELHPWHKHVSDRAAGAGAVPLLQNRYRFPHVTVHKVNLEVGTCRRLLLA